MTAGKSCRNPSRSLPPSLEPAISSSLTTVFWCKGQPARSSKVNIVAHAHSASRHTHAFRIPMRSSHFLLILFIYFFAEEGGAASPFCKENKVVLVSPVMDDGDWKKKQETTFTKWVNSALRGHRTSGTRVTDLASNLQVHFHVGG